MENLSNFLFGTPERSRYAIYAFFLVGAAVLLLAYRIRPYRRTILTFGAILIVFYAQAFLAIIVPPAEPQSLDPIGRSMGQLLAFIPMVLVVVAPIGLVATFLYDRMKVRGAKSSDSENRFNGPWSN